VSARIVVAVLFSVSLPLFAQPKPLIETYEVRVTSIEVVVTDRSGSPIRGLDRSSFRVLEDGVAQEITNFSEVDLASVADPAAETLQEPVRPDVAVRHVQIFIDEYSVDPFTREQTLDDLRRTLDLTLTDGDEVSIVRWTRRLKVELPFTRDMGRVFETLERIRAEGAQGATFAQQRREAARRIERAVDDGPILGYPAAYQDALSQARFYGEELRDNLRTLAEDLKSAFSSMGGLNGRKVMVFVGENLPRNPGIEMFEIADRAFEPYIGRAADSKGQALQRSESLTIESIARSANANGVSFYAVSSGNVARGKNAAESTPLLGLESVQFLSFNNSADSLQQIAGATGGATALQTNTLESMLTRLANDLQSYYSIGYRPQDSDDRVRKISVEVDVPDAVVRTRQAFVSKSSEEELGDRALSCLFRQRCETDFRIAIVKGDVTKKRRNRHIVPVEIRIPMASLTLVPQGEQSVGGFSVHVAALSEKGGLSEVVGKSQRVTVPVKDLPTIGEKYLTWATEILVERGTTSIVVAVADEVSQLIGFGKTEVVAE
jgi:VWFA-related protein